MFGIKDADPPNEENGEKNKDISIQGQKLENKEIRIVETSITISGKEKIKQKNVKKENIVINKEKYIKKEKEKPKLSLFAGKTDFMKKLEERYKIENKSENKKKELNNNNNIFNSKSMENPFCTLIENNNNESINDKDNNKTKINDKSIFNLSGNINNNDKDKKKETTNKQTSIFGNIGNDINKKDTKDNSNSLFSNTTPLFSGNKNNNNSLFLSNTNESLFSAKDKDNNNSLFEQNKTKSLFGENNGKSLFGENNYKSLFGENNGKSLFSGNNGKSLFGENSGKSLFGENNNKSLFSGNTPSLFSNNIINPFSQIKGESFLNSLNNNKNNTNNENIKNNESLFDNNNENNDNSEEDERDKPKTKYVAEPLKAQDYSDYSKLYNTHLDNLFLFNKADKKYISKGNGYFSIEKTKDEKDNKHQAVIVFRNQTGNKLVEGFIDKKFNKFEIYNKNFNYVVCLSIIRIVEEKPELAYIKIPFKNEEDSIKMKNAFNEAIAFLEKK